VKKLLPLPYADDNLATTLQECADCGVEWGGGRRGEGRGGA
jgi:hypothetical protein